MPGMDNAHALIIGIANYQHVRKLPPEVLKDARDIYDLLIDPQYCGYIKDNTQLLLDGEATQQAIRQALAALAARSNADSTVVLYISSHGERIESGPDKGEYLLPVDVVYENGEVVPKTAISDAEMTEALRAIPARKVLIIFDCCHSGGIGATKGGPDPIMKEGLSDSYYDLLKQGQGRVILASSRSTEFSRILTGDPNSLFTLHLLAGLKGGIASEDGLIRVFDLFEYVQPRVTETWPQQHPVFRSDIEDNFPVALYRAGQKGVVSKVDESFRYDAYVSYVDKQPDTGYVWDTLVPRLRDAGLRVAVSGDVEEPGVARVVNIERGIKQSKRTVVVLSDLYLDDHAADFENVMGTTIGIQEGTYRVLPVKISPVSDDKLPVRLSMLTSLNLADPARAQRGFERLVLALQSPLPRREV